MAMRTRQIHPRFWISESVASVGFFERLLFQALWGLADREGLLLCRPGEIRPQAFPHDSSVTKEVMIAGIDALVSAKLICIIDRIDGADDPAIFIPKFKEYQWINKDEAKSKLLPYYFTWNPDESIWVHTDPRQSYSYTLTFNDSNIPTINTPPKAPRKRVASESDEMLAAVGEVIDHLNAVTGRGFSKDKANEQIVRALKDGATQDDCKLVVSHLWETWSQDWRARIDKTTPFRKANFDRYLDAARAGRVTTSTAPDNEPIPREVLANLEFEMADGTDIEAWLAAQRPGWVPVLRERASRMAGERR